MGWTNKAQHNALREDDAIFAERQGEGKRFSAGVESEVGEALY
jgi:hypothetical protein